MADIPNEPYILSGLQSMRLRDFCRKQTWDFSDLDAYGTLIYKGPISAIRLDFESRVAADGIQSTRKKLSDLTYGPTNMPLYNLLLQFTIINSSRRNQFISTVRYLALEAKIPVNSTDLSGTTTFFFAISTKPFWDREFAEIMLKGGADVNHRNRFGCTAAHEIAMGQDYSAEGRKKTVEAMKYFLAKGGDIDIADGDEKTARQFAMITMRDIPELEQFLGMGGGEGKDPETETKKVGRNEPCPCGKRKKFKRRSGKVG